MNYESLKIDYARLNDIPKIQELILERCIWLKSIGIDQWRQEQYFKKYDFGYFKDKVEKKELYIAVLDGLICGVMVLKTIDYPLWEDDNKAVYIHNFATGKSYSKLGIAMLEEAKKIALSMGKQYLRLDCAKQNKKLNSYYEGFGFVSAGDKFISSDYTARKKELKL